MNLLLTLVPLEVLLPLVLTAGALGIILGLVAPRTLFAVVAGLVLLGAVSPVIGHFIGELNVFAQITILGLFGLAMARSVLRLILGRGAADHVVGLLAYDLLRLPFRLAGAILRLAIWPVRRRE